MAGFDDSGVRAVEVEKRLIREFPEAKCGLDFEDPWQLLVATVLSAQCTDERVNQITPELFRRWPAAADLAGASRGQVENAIRSAGLYRNKAKALQETAEIVAREHGGEVPPSMSELMKMPGVGRKTAKVVLGIGFGIAAGIAVDTHVRRVSHRLKLSGARDAERVARDLEELLPQTTWVGFSLRVIELGRKICHARKPACEACVLSTLCPSAFG